MNFQLMDSYIDQVTQLYREADVSVVPAELAKMEGLFAGIDQVAETIKAGDR